VSNQWEKARTNGADTAPGVCSPPQTVSLPILTSRQIGMQLGIAFSLLVAILIGIGYLGLSRMNQINANLNEVLGRQWTTLQLSRQALAYSSRNSRITMEIFLLRDKRVIDPLLKSRAENTQQITELVTEIESLCDTQQDKQLLAAVKDARVPYVASYLRALHLLLDEHDPEAASALMVEETTPALFEYHSAWENFVRLQMDQMDKAAKESRARYATARAFVLVLIVLAVFIATAIGVVVTRRITGEATIQSRNLEVAETICVQETTARQGLEEDLRCSEERLRMATDAARIGVWDWDVIQDKQVWSDTCKALLGLPPDSPADFKVLMNSVHPDDRKTMMAAINGAIQEKQSFAIEFRVLWPDGSVHWQASTGHAFYDDAGQTTRMAGITMDIDRRKLAEERQRLQAAALEAAANSIVITDQKGTILWTNPAFSELTGYAAEEARGRNPNLLKSGKQDKALYANLWKTITAGKIWHGEIINRRKDGGLYTEEMTITPVCTDSGEITHFVAIKQDITGRKFVEQALQQAEQKYREIFEDAVVGIFQTTPEGRFLSVNPALAQMYGYDSPEQLMTGVTDVARQLFVEPDRYGEVTQLLEQHGVVRNVESEILCQDGNKKWILANVRAVRGADGKIVRREGTIQDITERKAAEGQVQFLAYYDALTGLPNRTLFLDRLGKALASARRRREKVALLFLDLDRFKTINDSLGHSVGDLFLKGVAERLKKFAREQDTVARLGGDEFVVVLTAVKDPADAAVAADRIMKEMATAFVVQEHLLSVTCSLGISVFPDHGTEGETLLKNADAAMYYAKENGNSFQFFTQDMHGRAVERLTLENSLRLALEKEELFLVYQPQVNLATEKIIGAEALLRWRHPDLGLVPPSKFIPIAENCGMIIPIGEWVLKTACAQARQWQDEGLPAFPVTVNVSAVQFRQESFLPVIEKTLHETGLPPQYLELELTESLLFSNSDVMLSVLRDLKDMGLKLSIDDFGTGYSSLSYLRQFPVYKLKIDRSFVQAMTLNPDDAAITSTIINMAKTLNLKVIAEGVETEQQILFLREHNCDEVQGYYFSKPLAAGDFGEKVRRTALVGFDSSDSCRTAGQPETSIRS